MARRKKKRDSITRAALDVGAGSMAFGLGSTIVGRVPNVPVGASQAFVTGARMMPVYATTRVGGIMIGKMRRMKPKKRRK